MDRREFLINAGIITSVSMINPKIAFSKIKSVGLEHALNLKSDFSQYFDLGSNIFKTNYNLNLAIAGIECGKPNKKYTSGLAVESASGCFGIPQISYQTYENTLNWTNRISREINSPLCTIPKDKTFFKKLFLEEIIDVNNEKLVSAEVQIHLLAANMNYLISNTGSTDLSVCAYNWGLWTLGKMVNHYLDLNNVDNTLNPIFNRKGFIDSSSLKSAINQNNLGISDIIEKPKMKEYFSKLKIKKPQLRFADINYYKKVLEIKSKL